MDGGPKSPTCTVIFPHPYRRIGCGPETRPRNSDNICLDMKKNLKDLLQLEDLPDAAGLLDSFSESGLGNFVWDGWTQALVNGLRLGVRPRSLGSWKLYVVMSLFFPYTRAGGSWGHEVVSVRPGSTSLLRFINGAALVYLTVCIESHTLVLVALDGNPVAPRSFSECVDINSGQR